MRKWNHYDGEGVERFVTLNTESLKALKDMIYGKLITGEGGFGESDGIIRFTKFISGGETTYLQIRKLSSRPQGGNFPYINLTNIILAEFGVYTQIEPKEENCLVQSFQSAGLPTDGIYEKVKSQYIPKKDLIDISAQLNIQIKVCQWIRPTCLI